MQKCCLSLHIVDFLDVECQGLRGTIWPKKSMSYSVPLTKITESYPKVDGMDVHFHVDTILDLLMPKIQKY